MFRQEGRTELYLLTVIKGLAGDETNMSKKEEKGKLLMTGLAQGSAKRRQRLGWKQVLKGEGPILPSSHIIQLKRAGKDSSSWKDMAAPQVFTSPEYSS